MYINILILYGVIFVIKKVNSCPCAYCEYFKLVEYEKGYLNIQKGICRKHDIIRELYDEICEDFILKSGIYTEKWYPNKKEVKKP